MAAAAATVTGALHEYRLRQTDREAGRQAGDRQAYHEQQKFDGLLDPVVHGGDGGRLAIGHREAHVDEFVDDLVVCHYGRRPTQTAVTQTAAVQNGQTDRQMDRPMPDWIRRQIEADRDAAKWRPLEVIEAWNRQGWILGSRRRRRHWSPTRISA